MILNLTEQITQAQIATALVIIAVSLGYFAVKYGEKVDREKHGKSHKPSKN